MIGALGPFLFTPQASFRGDRNYIHSTDLYEEIVNGASKAGVSFDGPIDIRFRAKIISRPSYIFVDQSDKEFVQPENVTTQCMFRSGERTITVFVVEGNEPVVNRRQYDESQASKNSTIDGPRIVLAKESTLRPIETVTSLAVHLHKSLYPPPTGKRWMLGQLTLNRPLDAKDCKDLFIEIEKNSGAITRSRIGDSQGSIGAMLFVLS